MRKRLAVLMGAAILTATGGLALPAHSVFAETANAAAISNALADHPQADTDTAKMDYIGLLVRHYVSNLVEWTASLTDQDYGVLLQEVQSGKSIAEASGLNASDLSDKLGESLAQNFAADEQSGVLTPKEALHAKAYAIAAIKEAVSGAAGAAALQTDSIDGRDIVQSHINKIVQTTANLYELDAKNLRRALREGHSLAQASGQESGALAGAVTALLDRELDAAVLAGKLTSAEADKRKAEGEEAIRKIVATEGYDGDTTNWMKQFGDRLVSNKLGFIVPLTAALSGKDTDDVALAIEQGSTISSASGLSETELLGALSKNIDEAIDQAWLNGNVTASYADQLKRQAEEQLRTAITAARYGANAQGRAESVTQDETTEASDNDPAEFYAENRLNQVAADVAALSNIRYDDLLERLASGQTMSQASGISNNSLLYGLVKSASKQLNEYVDQGALSEEESARVKANYMSGLVQLLSYT
jgi:hypothetical protein